MGIFWRDYHDGSTGELGSLNFTIWKWANGIHKANVIIDGNRIIFVEEFPTLAEAKAHCEAFLVENETG
jgi:hypothetical protein